MNRFQHKAIEMKHQGYTYKEIADALEGKVSWHTIESWFRQNGILFIEYRQYVARMEEYALSEARERIKLSASIGGELLDELLKQAMESGDLHLAFKIVVKQLTLAGIVEPKSQPEPTEQLPTLTDEEFHAKLEELGIDPKTGLCVGA